MHGLCMSLSKSLNQLSELDISRRKDFQGTFTIRGRLSIAFTIQMRNEGRDLEKRCALRRQYAHRAAPKATENE